MMQQHHECDAAGTTNVMQQHHECDAAGTTNVMQQAPRTATHEKDGETEGESSRAVGTDEPLQNMIGTSRGKAVCFQLALLPLMGN